LLISASDDERRKYRSLLTTTPMLPAIQAKKLTFVSSNSHVLVCTVARCFVFLTEMSLPFFFSNIQFCDFRTKKATPNNAISAGNNYFVCMLFQKKPSAISCFKTEMMAMPGLNVVDARLLSVLSIADQRVLTSLLREFVHDLTPVVVVNRFLLPALISGADYLDSCLIHSKIITSICKIQTLKSTFTKDFE
jgi:hypothetical protein